MTENETSGFTMLYDRLVQELGLIPAAVLCVALRFCQLSDGVCRASVRTIAERLHLSYTPVFDALKRLAAEGYLEDLTPGVRNQPHRYRDTGKALGESARQERATARQERPTARQERPTARQENATVRQENATVLQENAAVLQENATVLHVDKKILLRDSLGDSLRDTEETRRAREPGVAAELRVFQEAARFFPQKQVFEEVIEAVRAVGKRLGRDCTAEDLKPFVKAWVGRGWNPYNLNWLFEWAVKGQLSAVSYQRSARRPTAMLGEGGAWRTDGNDVGGSDAGSGGRNAVTPEEHERLKRLYAGVPDG